MWLMLSSGFISVVANRDDKDTLLVRARLEGHIESVFPDAKIFTNEGSDYLFRSYIDRKTVSQVIAKNIENISYDNFKNSVKSKPYHDTLMQVWHCMYALQEKYASFKAKRNFGLFKESAI